MTRLAAMMQPVVLVLLAIAAVAPALAAGTSSSAINATCAAITDQPAGYCVSFLSNDTAAAAATDARGVAVAAVNITARMAASTLGAISSLVYDLTNCRSYYSEMVELLDGVLDDYRAGRFDDAATDKVANASGLPNGCDILLFEGSANKNPFYQENTDNDHIARLATDIANLVANNKRQSKS